MRDLVTYRDHCRAMATAQHLPDCKRAKRRSRYSLPDRQVHCPDDDPHDEHEWHLYCIRWDCPGICGGCIPDDQRALWQRLADELDAHLADGQEEALW